MKRFLTRLLFIVLVAVLPMLAGACDDTPDAEPAAIYRIHYEGVDPATNQNPTSFTENEAAIALIDPAPPSAWYTFGGWFRDEALTSPCTSVDPAKETADLTLWAKWEKVSYTLSFYAQDQLLHTESFDADTAAPTPPACPDREGYTGAWPTFTLSPENMTLTAVYTPIPYSITYGNLLGGETDSAETYTVAEQTVLGSAWRNGYNFLGWYDEDGRKIESIPQGRIGAITLRAEWELATYSITYNNIKGADISAYKTSYTVLDDGFDLCGDLHSCGYEFLGWLDQNGQRVTHIAQGSTGDLVLTAEWEAITMRILYSDSRGSHEWDESDFKQFYTLLDEPYTLPVLEAEGYIFRGWFNYFDHTQKVECLEPGAVSLIGCTYHCSDHWISLVARWERIPYTITYENTMWADLSGLKTSYTVADDAYTLPSISIAGGVFHGWLLNGEPITEIPKGTYGDLVITADVTPFSYQLVLENAYGDGEEATHTVYYGTHYRLPVPTAEGKVFLGWFDNVSETATAYTDGDGNSLIPYHKLTSRVLYARFAAQQCTVTYDTNGGNAIPAVTVDWGSAFDGGVVPTKEGAIFGGWYSADFSTKYTSATVLHGDVTVKAKWITATAVSTADEFRAIASNPGSGYYLVNDINLGGTVWSPIGTFSGFLDGNGYSVKNFSVSATSAGSTAFGFFCNNTGTIQNLVFEDFTFNFSATQERDINLGVLVGYNTGRLYNCVLKSGSVKITYTRTVTGDIKIGGLVGRNDGTISGCKNLVNVSTTQKCHYSVSEGMSAEEVYSYSKFGGLVGHNYGLIENSSVEATLTYTGSSSGHRKRRMRASNIVGGLVGEQAENGRIRNCYTNVTLTAATSNIYPDNDDQKEYSKSYLRLGGLVGANGGSISNSYSLGTVKGNYANTVYVGGFAGRNNGKIANCYSRANPYCSVSASVGGFVGENLATVQNSFAAGLVEGFGSVGGFVGCNASSGTVSKCYSTASVKASSGSVGFFAGVQSGVVLKCYFMNGAVVAVGGTYYNREVEHGSILRVEREVLWSEDFLKQTLYWDDEGWIILHSEAPILEWELAVTHDYELTVIEAGCETVGYTVYVCRDCNRFFVRDIVAPHGHEKTNFITVAPTCTRQGYNSYYCHRCECSVTEDVVLPTGHVKGELLDHRDASCTEDGYDIYACDACHIEGGVTYVIAAMGHTRETIDAMPSTCEKAGKTEEIFCSVCGDVLKESTVIPPHDLAITVLQEADCLSDGLCTKTCRNCPYTEENAVVPAHGHADINRDYRCDNCGVLSGTYEEADVVEISTLAELKGIIRDMNGVYRLMADLTLPEDWAGIGSDQKPFTGYFDGNGHTITFTKATSSVRGLFAYNKGIITTLNVVGCSLSVSQESAVCGFVAVKNAGYITNCHLGGEVIFQVYAALSSAEYATLTKTVYATFGGIVGINENVGTVSGCSTDAAVTILFHNTAECCADWSAVDLVRKGSYKKTHVTSVLTVTFGNIVGENAGTVESCTASGVTLCSGSLPEAIVEEYYGYSTAITTFNCGVLAGTGEVLGTVRDCEFGGSLTFKSADRTTGGKKEFLLFGAYEEYTLNLYE